MGAAAERDGHAHPKVLRRLHHVAQGRVLQQVAVVQGAQAKVLETQGALGVDGVVELAGVRFHELQQPFVDDADIETRANRLRE